MPIKKKEPTLPTENDIENISAQKVFQFRKSDHTYLLDGKPLTGVTTILGVINKPALIPWAVKTAIEHIQANLGPNGEVTPELLEEAKKQHTKKKDDAASKGTDVHALVEEYVKAAISGETYNYEKAPKEIQPFILWATTNNVRFLASEKRMYSEKMWVAGTCDLVCEISGEKFVADVKTSNGVYPTHFYQMGGYSLMLEEMGEQFDGFLVIHMPSSGKFDTMCRFDTDTDKRAFLGALAIYRADQTYQVKK